MREVTVQYVLIGLFFICVGPLTGSSAALAADQLPSGPEVGEKEIARAASLDEKNSLRIADQMIGTAIQTLQNDQESDAADDVAADLNRCMKRNGNMQQYGCLEDAYKKYDLILNAVYKHVLAISDESTKNKIREAQKKWVQFRDADKQASNSYWNNGNHGTVMGIVAGYNQIYVIRERILELMLYTGDEEG